MSVSNEHSAPVALITGASRGLGEVLAHFLAGQGYNLVLTARRAEILDSAAHNLDQYGGKVLAVPGDVADAAHRHKLAQAAESLGRLDLLINNASILGPTPLLTLSDYPLDELEAVFSANVFAPLGLVQAALPLLKASKGLVINVSSDAAVGGYETWGGYGSSKAALDLISKTLAHELKSAGVAVVSVDPGDMRTDMNQAANAGSDISGLPLPDATLPFWAWLLGQDRAAISGGRFQAQAERWEVAS
jgi:NAD(P)-dependent dehydrogenase (short-subunit alcohol dehydrogenase family)